MQNGKMAHPAHKIVPQYQTLSNEELFGLYLKGDISAFDQYYARMSPKVYGFIKKRTNTAAMADEVFQEVWIKVHRCRDQYDSRFPINPWIFTITRSILLDSLRTVSRKKELLLETEELTRKVDEANRSLNDTTIETSQDFNETLDAQMQEVLTPEQRKLIDLRYMNDWSFYDIAASLGLSEDNVRQKISRALKKLRGRFVL